MSIRELIKKQETAISLLQEVKNRKIKQNISFKHSALCREYDIELIIREKQLFDLKQCLADCKSEVEREIEGCKYNMMTKTNFEQGLYSGTLNGLQKLNKIFGRQKEEK
jgi:hypothetical protein